MRGQEKTLLVAWLLALWSPLVYGIAALIGQSSLMVADLLRRSIELLALFLAWFVYRQGAKRGWDEHKTTIWNRRVDWGVGVALLLSFALMASRSLGQLRHPVPVGRVEMGIVVAFLGLVVNGWFWRKYSSYSRQDPSSIFGSQFRLFRSKTILDAGVGLGLLLGAGTRGLAWGPYIDPLGSLLMSGVLLVSGIWVIRAGRPRDLGRRDVYRNESGPEG